MKTGFVIYAALMMYCTPSMWRETLVAVAIGLVLFWRVPEPWATSAIEPRKSSCDDSQMVSASFGGDNDGGLACNPASGLPMANAQFDVAGNPFGAASSDGNVIGSVTGFSFNPANGLPMSDTSFDVCGNAFGTTSSDNFFE